MLWALGSIGIGLAVLFWSAELFVDASVALARRLGVPPLVIGMVVVGFGTSAPEMAVSVLASLRGSAGVALGNAYGSNITNIALILGLAAIINPISVQSQVIHRQLPILLAATALAAWQVRDGEVGRGDALVLLATFTGLMVWTLRQGTRRPSDALGTEMQAHLELDGKPPHRAGLRLVTGLALLVGSSRLLVWGAVRVAETLGVGDLVIGLTVVAFGTSLPELASSVVAARRGEHDIALGNVLGSNLFNTLAVVGLAGAVHPLEVAPGVITRDVPTMAALTCAVLVLGIGLRRPGRISRTEGAGLLLSYAGYLCLLTLQVLDR